MKHTTTNTTNNTVNTNAIKSTVLDWITSGEYSRELDHINNKAAIKAITSAFFKSCASGKYGMRTVYNIFPFFPTVSADVLKAVNKYVSEVNRIFGASYGISYTAHLFIENEMYCLRVHTEKLGA